MTEGEGEAMFLNLPHLLLLHQNLLLPALKVCLQQERGWVWVEWGMEGWGEWREAGMGNGRVG